MSFARNVRDIAEKMGLFSTNIVVKRMNLNEEGQHKLKRLIQKWIREGKTVEVSNPVYRFKKTQKPPQRDVPCLSEHIWQAVKGLKVFTIDDLMKVTDSPYLNVKVAVFTFRKAKAIMDFGRKGRQKVYKLCTTNPKRPRRKGK